MRRRLNSKVVSRLKLFPRRASQAGEFVKSGLRPQTASELAEKIRLICNRFFPYDLLAQPTRLHWPPALAPADRSAETPALRAEDWTFVPVSRSETTMVAVGLSPRTAAKQSIGRRGATPERCGDTQRSTVATLRRARIGAPTVGWNPRLPSVRRCATTPGGTTPHGTRANLRRRGGQPRRPAGPR